MAGKTESQLQVPADAPGPPRIDLRLTSRCWEDDLGTPPDHDGVETAAERQPIVAKFLSLRGQSPVGQEIFVQGTSRPDMYTLHAGQVRGVTWYDKEYYVVWLLGFATHRAGHHSDAYEQLAALDRKQQLLPTVVDYEELLRARAAREIPEMVFKIRSLLVQARAEPEHFHSTLVKDGVRVSLCVIHAVDASGGIEEFRLAISAYNLEPGWLDIIRTTLWPYEETEGWDFPAKKFTDLPPNDAELRFTHWHAVEEGKGSDGE